jgi:cytochrome c peroxidase
MNSLKLLTSIAILGCLPLAGCIQADEGPAEVDPATIGDQPPEALRAQALVKFGTLPLVQEASQRTVTEAKITLGRQLFFERRLSKNHDLSCNSCHDLAQYGVDRRLPSAKVSLGHRSQLGTRNTPTVYNAARQLAQFWDGRAVDVEAQAQGPIINPVEMAMLNAASVVAVLKSIPGYLPLFKAAFPAARDPITYENLGLAIGAFERKLVTQDRFDLYLEGDMTALSPAEVRGLYVFLDAGCPSCHDGAGMGGTAFKKLGSVTTYATNDVGRFTVTKKEDDRYVFKVPTLRNVEMTAPYLHDGSQATLKDVIRLMMKYQTIAGTRSEEDIAAVEQFLKTLTGELPTEYIKAPAELPASATTPRPDPS